MRNFCPCISTNQERYREKERLKYYHIKIVKVSTLKLLEQG